VDRVNHGRVDPKDLFGWQANNSRDRLTMPLIRRGDTLTETDWDTAMDAIVDRTRSLLGEHEVIAHDWIDHRYVDAHTVGYDELAARVAEYSPQRVAEICRVPADAIRRAAESSGTPSGCCPPCCRASTSRIRPPRPRCR
jgi:anaerobic selenocysteine-containing dehydrogenase